jgi:HAD superfamily hydrolase (TIGR01549 family)
MWNSVNHTSDIRGRCDGVPRTIRRMLRDLEAVIFDMDGTLFDSMVPVTDAFITTILETGGPRYTPDEIVEAFTVGSSERMLEHLLGRPVTQAEHTSYHRRLDAGASAMHPYAAIEAALTTLADAGLRLALFTGADVTSLDLLLGRTGIRERFEVRTGGDEAGLAKPDPAGIVLTCARLGVEPECSAYVGDSEQDMLAARAAGALAVGAGWGSLWRDGHPADIVVREPAGLAPALTGPVNARKPGPSPASDDASTAATSALGDDLNRDDGVDLVEEVDPDLVGTDRTDRLVEVDVALVDRHPLVLRGDRLGDMLGGDRPEELAFVAGTGPNLDRSARDEPRCDGFELALARVLPPLVSTAEILGLLGRSLMRSDGDRAWDQVVARVAVGNLDHVSGVSELVDGLLEDDLHRLEYGSSAIWRAFFTAVATSRWCWTQLPVTRRARILPRSLTNLRNVTTSL